jgi:leucine dehydrogenase
MAYFEAIQEHDHNQVVFCSDKASGLRAIIAIHNTVLGPALGGCRMQAYANEEAALKDVLKLSRAMTYKASVSNMNLGGGKTVVLLDRPEDKTPELLRALGKCIANLKGLYIGAGDIGSNTHDLKIMKEVCPFVAGLSIEDGGLGDSAVLTSYGVLQGIQAAVKTRLGKTDLKGLKIGVQGVGKVGYNLVKFLHEAGATITVTDVVTAAMERVKQDFPDVLLVDNQSMIEMPLDVFSPNGGGGTVTPEVAQAVQASIVAGGANNVLSDEAAGVILKERDILFAPDFVINGGGIIMVGAEFYGQTFAEAKAKTALLYDKALEVFAYAAQQNITPLEAARQIALSRIEKARSTQLL